ncbi:hypothetical protein [Acinetobacter sp. YH12070]|uniref:hypothetical protein n=1 Tax=Acinetobacter sp. YH12070 TaxID=2601066 RepID=UPI0015D35F17|nr:hypothetical protein [Acinetobacter sp. YH12070]
MNLNEIQKNIERISIENWNRSFSGTSSSEIAKKIDIEHSLVMKAMENLVSNGLGSINANVEMCEVSMDIDMEKPNFNFTPIILHIYFPSKNMLEEYFYTSDLVRKDIPEYKKRLHLGAHQLGQVFFDEAVLSRYFDYPEYYDVDDSRSGGHIYIASDKTPEERYIHVRHGRKTLLTNQSVVIAIYKDLENMSEFEQRHWHAHELNSAQLDFCVNDEAYQNFYNRNYEGAWIEYKDDLLDLTKNIELLNSLLGDKVLNKTENIYCNPPVENTNKAYFDSCSELFKLVGPDNINQKTLKTFLKVNKACIEQDFIHEESGRSLSAIQLMELFEEKIGVSKAFTKSIRLLQKDRTEADHKITELKISEDNLVEKFFSHINELNRNILAIIEIIKNPL